MGVGGGRQPRWALFQRGVVGELGIPTSPFMPQLVLDERAGTVRILPETTGERLVAVEPLLAVDDVVEAAGERRRVARIDSVELAALHLVLTSRRLVVLGTDRGLPLDGGAATPAPLVGVAERARVDLAARVLPAAVPTSGDAGEGDAGGGAGVVRRLQRAARFATIALPLPSLSALCWGGAGALSPPEGATVGVRLMVGRDDGAPVVHWIVATLARPHRLAQRRTQVFEVALQAKAALFDELDCTGMLSGLGAVDVDPSRLGQAEQTGLGPAVGIFLG